MERRGSIPDIIPFEELTRRIDPGSLEAICRGDTIYNEMINDRKVWDYVLLQHYGIEGASDPRDTYLKCKRGYIPQK